MKKITLCIAVFLLLLSCGMGPIKWKGFTNYSKPISTKTSKKIRTDGVYVQETTKTDFLNSFYLYRNGLYYPDSFDKNFKEDNKYYLEQKNKKIKESKFHYDGLGNYRISNDTIYIQAFAANNNEFFSKWIIEDKGVILNDSTIKIFSSYSYLGKIELINEPQIHRFYPTKVKPDSTNLFYKNKKWYQEGLHESRK